MGNQKVTFTTGEAAKMCNVSVRTVQYYDKEGIVKPLELAEGGRRIYRKGFRKVSNSMSLQKPRFFT